jgi:hypothetical protein
MTRLGDIATFVRSKNAGPFTCTIDILFSGPEDYGRVVDSGVLNAGRIGQAYGLPPEKVRIFAFDPAHAIKISIPRLVSCGDPADTDVMGGQQFVPLLDVEIPSTAA